MNATTAFRRLYNHTLRPLLPRKTATYNGIPAEGQRLLDLTTDFPDYEQDLLESIRGTVEPTDDVVIVGGGLGISSVVGARMASLGSVTAYEGGAGRVRVARRTVNRARVSERVRIHHAIVGDAVEVWGDTTEATVVSPADLPPADVLVLDCEGAEINILAKIDRDPRAIIVEYHPERGAELDEVALQLRRLGYGVTAHRDEQPVRGVLTAEGGASA